MQTRDLTAEDLKVLRALVERRADHTVRTRSV
jgi:hypothetical protein